MTDARLTVRALCIRRERTALIENLDFDLAEGETVALRGANGSGKSTLLRACAGVWSSYEGEIRCAPAVYVAHANGISGLMSAAENLQWYAALVGVQKTSAELRQALDRFGVAQLARRPCNALSAGQKRRVALARLLLVERPVWLLDEPFTALDADGEARLNAVLQDHTNTGGAALVAVHADLDAAARELWLGADA